MFFKKLDPINTLIIQMKEPCPWRTITEKDACIGLSLVYLWIILMMIPLRRNRLCSMNRKLKSEWVADRVRDAIRRDRWPPGDLLAPERELCESLGVSRGSLRGGLKRLHAEGLIEADTTVGWRVTALPPPKRPGRRREPSPVLLITSAARHQLALLAAAEKRAATSAAEVTLRPVSFPQLVDPEAPRLPLDDLTRFDALIVFVNALASRSVVQQLDARGKPYCVIHHPVPLPCDCVATDWMLNARRTVEELAKRGHRHLVYLGSHSLERHDASFRHSRTAFEAECSERGLRCSVLLNDYNTWIRQRDRALFLAFWREHNAHEMPPTAIYTDVAWIAFPFIHSYLEELGQSIPDDISFLGTDCVQPEDSFEDRPIEIGGFGHDTTTLIEAAFQKIEARRADASRTHSMTLIPPTFSPGDTLADCQFTTTVPALSI